MADIISEINVYYRMLPPSFMQFLLKFTHFTVYYSISMFILP